MKFDEGCPAISHGGRELCLVDLVAPPGIDAHVVFVDDATAFVPPVEQQPVVGPDDEGEFAVGVAASEVVERANCVGGEGERKLHIGHHDFGIARHGESQHLDALPVGLGRQLFPQGVLRRHRYPHLVEPLVFAQVAGQYEVPRVDGVERA